jgi:2'-5' RNA ligase
VRLFVGAWPPPEVRRALGALDRPDTAGVRWTAPDRWHVTLAFCGEQGDDQHGPWAEVVVAAARALAGPPEAVLGPATVLLGPAVLCVPVAGLEGAADAVRAAAGRLGLAGSLDPRPFRGHLTLARGRGRGRIPPALAGAPVEARWAVVELVLVASPAGPGPTRYETLASATVGG